MADRCIMELDGLMLERLLNRACSESACFSNVIRLSRRRISVAADRKSASILRSLAEKYHIDCRIVQISGISAVISRLRRRITLLISIAVMVAICHIYLSHVHVVDIELLRGDAIPDGIIHAIHDSDLRPGVKWDSIDMHAAAMQLTALEGCAHASLKRQGVALIIELVCEEPSPSLYEKSESRDLVALCDGVISSVNVKNGTAMVAPGDTVKKGQVLISGYERAGKDDFTDLGALGSVTARIWAEGEASASTFRPEKHYTGRESQSASVSTPWFTFPLTCADAFTSQDTYISRMNIGGLFIPLYIEKTLNREYAVTYTAHDIEALKLTLEADSYANALENTSENTPENAEIIDKWTDFSMIESEEFIHARTVLELEAEIAVTRGYLEGY